MAMIKHGISFQNSVDEIIDGKQKCEKCSGPLNLMESKDGVVECPNSECKFRNKIQDMEAIK